MGKLKFKALFIGLAAVLGVAASSALFWEKTSDVSNTFKLSKTESGISIMYDANGGMFDNKASTNAVVYDKKDFSILSGEEKTPTRKYYTFKGWYLDKTCMDGQELDITTGKYADTVYAKWTEDTITINYDANGGFFDDTPGNTTNAVVYKQGTKLTLLSGEVKTPTREGYDFDGWYYTKACNKGMEFSPTKRPRLSDLKSYPYVFAKWTRTVIDAAKLTAFLKDNGGYAITSIGYSSSTSGTNVAPDGEDTVYANVRYSKLYLSTSGKVFISGDAGGMFNGCGNLSNINSLSNWDVSGVTNMNSMFSDCSSISNISSLKSWNVANVTDMGSMFLNCTGLSDISSLESWNVSKVTNMVNAFKGCSSLTDASKLSNWQVSTSSCDVTDAFTDAGITDNSLYPKWYIVPSAAKLNLWSEGDWSLD